MADDRDKTLTPKDLDKIQWFYDFHYAGFTDGGVTGSCFMTQTIKRPRPEIPLQGRDLYLSIMKKSVQEDVYDHIDAPPMQAWWEKNYACIEYPVTDTEFWQNQTPFPEMAAWVLITCLYERSVQRVVIEPSKPKSRIAKKLAARRSNNQPDTAPETVLYVPARFYKPGSDTTIGTHAPKHLHYRNPHWRRQPYGSRDNPCYRDVWIEGMFINAMDCTEAEKAEVKIRPRNFKLLA